MGYPTKEFEEVRWTYDLMCRNFMVNDIRRGIDDAQANYLVALGIFSYLEVLGGFITGNGALSDHSSANFNAAIAQLPQCYRDLNDLLQVRDENGVVKKGLYSAFRCGLVHEYAPKGQVTVMNNPGQPADPDRCGVEVVEDNGENRLIINNNELFRDFRELLEEIGQWIDQQEETYYPRVRRVLERMAAYRVTV